jgi:hypothetical protein
MPDHQNHRLPGHYILWKPFSNYSHPYSLVNTKEGKILLSSTVPEAWGKGQ